MRVSFTPSVILALSAVVVLGGCGSDGVELRVDVRTDWVPGVEFSEIEISLDGESETVIYDASFEDDFLTGIRVATLEDVKPGLVTVRARILAADGRLRDRPSSRQPREALVSSEPGFPRIASETLHK